MYNNEKIKILYISPLPPPYGGIASWTKTVIDWAEKNNKIIGVVNTTKSKKDSFSPGSNIGIISQLIRTKNIIKDLVIKLKKNDFDLVHINSGPSMLGLFRDLICIKIVRLFKKKVVIQFHYDMDNFKKNKQFFNRLLKIVTSDVDLILVLNELSLKVVLDNNNFTDVKIIPNFIKDNLIKNNKKHNLKLQNIGYLGAIKETKGISEIMKVADQLPELNFHLIGPIEDKKYLNNDFENVFFYGALEHSEALFQLNKTDIFLFLSHTEGSSLSVLEAMAQGLPIITTDVGANLSVLENTSNFIVDKDNLYDICEKITLLEDYETRRDVGEQNLKTVKKYSSEIVISELFCSYEEIIYME